MSWAGSPGLVPVGSWVGFVCVLVVEVNNAYSKHLQVVLIFSDLFKWKLMDLNSQHRKNNVSAAGAETQAARHLIDF